MIRSRVQPYFGPTRFPLWTDLENPQASNYNTNSNNKGKGQANETVISATVAVNARRPRRHHKCVLQTCRGVENVKITFHNVPQTISPARTAWLKAIRRSLDSPAWMPTKGDKLCSLHFDPKDVITSLERTFIRQEAFPKRFLEKNADGSRGAAMNASGNSNFKIRYRLASAHAKDCRPSVVQISPSTPRFKSYERPESRSMSSSIDFKRIRRKIRHDHAYVLKSKPSDVKHKLKKLTLENGHLKTVIKNLNQKLCRKDCKLRELRKELARSKSYSKWNLNSHIVASAEAELVPKVSTFKKRWLKESIYSANVHRLQNIPKILSADNSCLSSPKSSNPSRGSNLHNVTLKESLTKDISLPMKYHSKVISKLNPNVLHDSLKSEPNPDFPSVSTLLSDHSSYCLVPVRQD